MIANSGGVLIGEDGPQNRPETCHPSGPSGLKNRPGLTELAAMAQSVQTVMDAKKALPKLARKFSVPGNARACVFYGGGKDSTFLTWDARLTQELFRNEHGWTFEAHFVSFFQPGMPRQVIETISRVYRNLGILDNPECKAWIVDGRNVIPFRDDYTLPESTRAEYRHDLLVSGHRTQGDPRRTTCDRCNIAMAQAFSVAISHVNPHFILTGDSVPEQVAYAAWIRRASRRLGLPKPEKTIGGSIAAVADSIASVRRADLFGGTYRG